MIPNGLKAETPPDSLNISISRAKEAHVRDSKWPTTDYRHGGESKKFVNNGEFDGDIDGRINYEDVHI